MTAALHTLEKALTAGLDYILSMQAKDGSWTEWALPPGSSSPWTTAYLGYKLRFLPGDLIVRAASHIALAARWQSDNAFSDGGWGYNASVGSDADSTAYAILFLRSAGQPVPDAAYTLLASLQNADGGFATYSPEGELHSWNVSHPDVTPMALLALLTYLTPDHHMIQRGIEYILQQKTARGWWNSFWWTSCLYGTEASLSLLDATGIKMPPPVALTRIEPTNAFETALLISSLLIVDRDDSHGSIHALVDHLLAQQRPDGSWNTAPILCITRRDCYEPWTVDHAGQLYTELNRLFTTATVLYSLTRVFGA